MMQESSFQNNSIETMTTRRRSKDDDIKVASKNDEILQHPGDDDGHSFGRTTSYMETLLHLLKSNIGPGTTL